MKKVLFISFAVCVFVGINHTSFAQDWKSSKLNWENSDLNPDNSPYNSKNSPYNKDNNPYNIKAKNVTRDDDGNATGYRVKKEGGGSNSFDLNGKRTGYGYFNDEDSPSE